MKYCCSRKRPDHMIKSKASVSPSEKNEIPGRLVDVRCFCSDALGTEISSPPQGFKCNTRYTEGQLYHLPFGDSSASLNGTMQSGKSQQSYVPFLQR